MHRWSISIALLLAASIPSSIGEQSMLETVSQPQHLRLTEDQRDLLEFAVGRFGIQGLDLPAIEFVFHPDLTPCNGHKGRYHVESRILEMCSMDRITMLHELAHAWANENLTTDEKEAFVTRRSLPSWNDHDTAWDQRGTEHVAETIAWALADDPHHVKWIDTQPDGTKVTNHRILTLGIDVGTLRTNFTELTGMEPVFRHRGEWTVEDSESISPERARAGR